MKSTELERAAYNLVVKYNKDLDAYEFCLEIESFKHQAQTLLPCVESATPLELCQLIRTTPFQVVIRTSKLHYTFFWLGLLLLRHVKGASVK
jgi:hypothetical protein